MSNQHLKSDSRRDELTIDQHLNRLEAAYRECITPDDPQAPRLIRNALFRVAMGLCVNHPDPQNLDQFGPDLVELEKVYLFFDYLEYGVL